MEKLNAAGGSDSTPLVILTSFCIISGHFNYCFKKREEILLVLKERSCISVPFFALRAGKAKHGNKIS